MEHLNSQTGGGQETLAFKIPKWGVAVLVATAILYFIFSEAVSNLQNYDNGEEC